jgi:hypothetical protein
MLTVVKFRYGLVKRIAIMNGGNYPIKYANIILAIDLVMC